MTLSDLIRSNEIQGLALHGLGMIAKLAKVGDADTDAALAAIRGVLAVVSSGADGSATVEDCRGALHALDVRIAAADAAADARAAAKPSRPDGTPL